MFTGISEETGIVQTVTERKVVIECKQVLDGTKIGDSIAVNGVCLTVTAIDKNSFTADISPETFMVTALHELRTGYEVNLERALPVNGRFGGHIVSGHADACGRVVSVKRDGIAILAKVAVPEDILKYVAVKGSVTLDGASLTVTAADHESLTVSLIPHTAANTTLGTLEPGDTVNVEVDMLARYIERLMSFAENAGGNATSPGLTLEFLKENGF